MSEHKYLGGLVGQCGFKIIVDKEKDRVCIELDGKLVKELTSLEAMALASELLLDSTFYFDNVNYKYRGRRWMQNWCYDADIIVKYERSD